MSTQPNPYAMSMDELRQLAESTPAPEPTPAPEQPRDEQGRFVATDPDDPALAATPVIDTLEDPNAPITGYQITIDLEDGSGVQVFEADTKDELVQKLAEAQKNATRKIRELSKQAPPVVTPAPITPTYDPQDEAALAQQLLSEPSAAIRRALEKELGMTVAEAKEQLRAAHNVAATARGHEIAKEFLSVNPDFYETPVNEDRMIKFLEYSKLPVSVENLQTAFDTLKSDGLLVPKPADPAAVAPVRRSSGLSTRTTVSAPVKTENDKLREAYNMPLDKLRELAELTR